MVGMPRRLEQTDVPQSSHETASGSGTSIVDALFGSLGATDFLKAAANRMNDRICLYTTPRGLWDITRANSAHVQQLVSS